MVLLIAPRTMDELLAHALRGYPHEVIGLLTGDAVRALVVAIEPLDNEERVRARLGFRVSETAFRAAVERARRGGHDVLGTYHSHPDRPAHCSSVDVAHADPQKVHLIVALRRDRIADVRCWRRGTGADDVEAVPFELSAPNAK
jgi:proteasome lid subunit RPN8/RPN11